MLCHIPSNLCRYIANPYAVTVKSCLNCSDSNCTDLMCHYDIYSVVAYIFLLQHPIWKFLVVGCYEVENTVDLQCFLPCNLVNWL